MSNISYPLSDTQRRFLIKVMDWLRKKGCSEKVQWRDIWNPHPTTHTIYTPIDRLYTIVRKKEYDRNDRDVLNALRELYIQDNKVYDYSYIRSKNKG